MSYYADRGQFDFWSLGYNFAENKVNRSKDASTEVNPVKSGTPDLPPMKCLEVGMPIVSSTLLASYGTESLTSHTVPEGDCNRF